MLRTYPLKHYINKGKQEKVRKTLKEYRHAAERIASYQWSLFFTQKNFNKNVDIKHIQTGLSERYKQTCQYQVVEELKSFISNKKNDFKDIVLSSVKDEKLRIELLYINKYSNWFNNVIKIPKFKNGKRVVGEYEDISLDVIKLARAIFKHVLKINKKPSFNHCNMALDCKVAQISKKRGRVKLKGKKKTKKGAKSFDYWVKLSTLEKGEPIFLPLKSNGYFESKKGKIKRFVQINEDGQDNLIVALIKDVKKKKYKPETKEISLDFGLRNIFASDFGDLLGRNFIDELREYDTKISDLMQNRQRQQLPVSSKKYKKVVNKLKTFIKNEINRVLNRIIELYSPKNILLEKIDFYNPDLSKKMNRLLKNCGRKVIKKKLDALKEEFKIKVDEMNPAYTSRECPSCHYVDKLNRKSQSKFECRFCGLKMHADVKSAKVMRIRSSDKSLCAKTSKAAILDELVRRFIERWNKRAGYSSAKSLLCSNPYFVNAIKDYCAQL